MAHQYSTFTHEIEHLDIEVEVTVTLNVSYENEDREVGFQGGYYYDVCGYETDITSPEIKAYFDAFSFEDLLNDRPEIWMDDVRDHEIEDHEDRIFCFGR